MAFAERMLPLAGRWLIAAIFLWSGLHKLQIPAEALVGNIASHGLPLPEVARWVAIAIELGGGGLLVAGFQTRSAAAVLALFCLVTAFAFHTAVDQQIDFLKNLAMAGGLLQIVAFGGGAWSLDARARQGRSELSPT